MIRSLLLNRENDTKPAIIEDGRAVPYAAIAQKARALRPLLPRDRRENIAVLLPDGSNFVAALWGVIQAGMTVFPLDPLMTAHEIIPLLKRAHVSTVIASAKHRRLLEDIDPEVCPLSILYIDDLRPSASDAQCQAADVGPGQPMLLLNTSGTTGDCKIVQLSEANVEASAIGQLDKMCLSEKEISAMRLLLGVPFSSIYGIMMLSICLRLAVPVVFVERLYTLDALYRAAERHRATHFEGSTSIILMMERMAGRPVPYDVRSLVYFGFGGSKVSGEVIDNVRRAYPGIAFSQGYGMTEAGPLLAKQRRDNLVKPGSVGTAIQGVKIAVETENGITYAPHTVGEIVAKGPNVMLGYSQNEADTKKALRDGYLHTGDIGYLDETGYLYICGRKKNMIIARGYNIYPEEVEACLMGSQMIRDCYVYGRMDAVGNETICADIVPIWPEMGTEAIRLYCHAHLADYKQPHQIAIVDSIQKNTAGKTVRKAERLP